MRLQLLCCANMWTGAITAFLLASIIALITASSVACVCLLCLVFLASVMNEFPCGTAAKCTTFSN